MESGEAYYFLVGLLELLFGFFFFVLSLSIYLLDIFRFKIKGKRFIVVAILFILSLIFIMHGGFQAFENYLPNI